MTYLIYLLFRRIKLIENELVFWCALIILMGLFLMQMTGRLLPLDHTGYWSVYGVVETFKNIPLFDFFFKQTLTFINTDPHHALGRSFALHLFILPVSVLFLITLFGYLIHRTSLRIPQTLEENNSRWNIFTYIFGFLFLFNLLYIGRLEFILTDPAEIASKPSVLAPTTSNYLLQLFIPFHGGSNRLIPVILLALIVLLIPFIAKSNPGKIIIRLGIIFMLLFGNILVIKGLWQDHNTLVYQDGMSKVQMQKNRALALAQSNSDWHRYGAFTLLQNDMVTQGPKLFAQHCASCHRYNGHDGLGNKPNEKPLASDLKRFGSREWVAAILDPNQISDDKYFGCTPFKNGKMAKYIKLKIPKLKDEEKEKLKMGIWALSAEAALPYQRQMDNTDSAAILKGQEYLKSPLGCSSCHRLREDSSQGSAPDLAGYGSRQWLMDFINDPGQSRFYGDKNAGMPAFGESNLLTKKQIEMLADWIREESNSSNAQKNIP